MLLTPATPRHPLHVVSPPSTTSTPTATNTRLNTQPEISSVATTATTSNGDDNSNSNTTSNSSTEETISSPDGLISVAYLKHRLLESGIPLTDRRLAGIVILYHSYHPRSLHAHTVSHLMHGLDM
jgi:hypothetical protein